MDCGEPFDGIWASESLLHVPRRQIDEVLERLARMLRSGGVLYASFRLGTGEGLRGEVFFNDMSFG
jgi:hypothetical protein